MKRRYRVACSAEGRHGAFRCSCGWVGYRMADDAAAATVKPCPRCGCTVVSFTSRPSWRF